MNFKITAITLLFLNTFICYSQVSVLFIGNSLTYVNDLPATFQKLCSDKGENVMVKMVAFPGYSLKEHLTTYPRYTKNSDMVWAVRIGVNDTILPEAIRIIYSNRWDYIFLQDRGPFEDSLDIAVKRIRLLAPKSNILLFENYLGDEEYSKKYARQLKKNNIREFKQLAASIGGKVIPACIYFEKIKKKWPTIRLYDETMHPTIAGTRVIAILIYDTIFNHEKINLTRKNINRQ